MVAGDFDYFLKIRVRDIADFNRLHSEQLIALPSVRQTRTFFVMKEVNDNAPVGARDNFGQDLRHTKAPHCVAQDGVAGGDDRPTFRSRNALD